MNSVRLPANYHLDNQLFTKINYRMTDLNFMEEIHNSLEVYIWLSYKYEIEFIERELARILKDRVCKIIDSIIEKQYFDSFADLKTENAGTNERKTNKLIDDLSIKEDFTKKNNNFSLIKSKKENIFEDDL